MTTVYFENTQYPVAEGDSVLHAMIKQGVTVDSHCVGGVCQRCLLRADKAELPAQANAKLPASLKQKNYFLACQCFPTQDIRILPSQLDDVAVQGRLAEREQIDEGIWLVKLLPDSDYPYKSGQFINVFINDVSRSYSLSSIYGEDECLELLVSESSDNDVSPWLCEQAAIGDSVHFSHPCGECYYQKERDKQRELILVSTGGGVANSLGVLSEALMSGHTMPIKLYHGVSSSSHLIYQSEFYQLEYSFDNFRYIPCVSRESDVGVYLGRVTDIAFKGDLSNCTVFIAGSYDMVETCRAIAQQNGAKSEFIVTDIQSSLCVISQPEIIMPEPAATPTATEEQSSSPTLWDVLNTNNTLSNIIDDIYYAVHSDSVLSANPELSNERYSKEAIYSLYRHIMNEEDAEFSSTTHPANGWVRVEEHTYNYRSQLTQVILGLHNIDKPHVNQWVKLENRYRNLLQTEHNKRRFD